MLQSLQWNSDLSEFHCKDCTDCFLFTQTVDLSAVGPRVLIYPEAQRIINYVMI
ncbi:MAG: hypothetical protein ACI91R_001092, partial [Vicingaceae bacterium]